MKNKTIHMSVVKRLLAVFIVLTLAFCTFDYYYEIEKIDERVLQIALEESRHFMSDELYYIKSGDIENLTLNANAHLKYSEFMVIEFYDITKKRLVEVTKPGVEHIEKEFNNLPHEDLLGGVAKYQRLEYLNHLYLRVASPLFHDGSQAGYFEGIYAVSDSALSEIRSQMTVSLIKVMIVVFITTAIIYPILISLNKKVLNYASVLLEANIGALESLGNAVAKRDSDTSEHNYRVTLYSIELAKKLRFDNDDLQGIVKGAFLHDVGKIAISDSILLKPGKLTDNEFSIMKTHVSHGVEILKDYQWIQEAVRVVESHHEKFDGTGYLRGLKELEIPETARVFCIVDVFDALTSERPYKKAFSYEESVGILNDGSGKHFDPHILEVFLSISRQIYDELRQADEQTLRELLRIQIREIFM